MRAFAWGVLGIVVAGCYDLDALRAGRDLPIDAGTDTAAPIPDASVDARADAAPVSCPTTAPADALVGYYPLDETSGPGVTDCSSAKLDGVVIGPQAQWTSGHHGGGLRLSDSAGCVQLGSAASASILDFTGAFSVTAWINVASFPASGSVAGYIAGKTHDPDLAGWRLATGSGGMLGATIALPTKTRLAIMAGPIATGTWTHVALVVVPGGDLTLYIDGALPQPPQTGVPKPLVPDPAAAARLGCRSDGTQSFDGVLDDVHVYARALTPAEIATLAK